MLALFLTIALAVQQSEPATDRWELVTESEDGTIVSIDPSTVETRKGVTYAWEFWDFSKDPTESEGTAIRLMGNRCSNSKRAGIVDRSFDRKGAFITQFKFEKIKWDDVRPDSVGDALMIASCRADASRKREPQAVTQTDDRAGIVFTPVLSTRAELIHLADGVPETLEIKSVDDALALLADKRMAPIWPQIVAWAGPGIEGLRERIVAEARLVAQKGRTNEVTTSYTSVVRPRLRAVFTLANALWDAGRAAEAIALIENARGSAPKKGRWAAIEWGAMSMWLASSWGESSTDQAIAILEESIPAVAADRSRVNLDVNLAALYLEVGRDAEALQIIDDAEAKFATPGGGGLFSGYMRVRGSDRQFAWIRACALHRLGRTADAVVAAAPLDPTTEPEGKQSFMVPTIKLRQLLARCTHDVVGAAQAYADALLTGPAGDDALLELQPGLAHPQLDPVFMAAVRQHPILVPILSERMRSLPDEMLPALQGWKTVPRN